MQAQRRMIPTQISGVTTSKMSLLWTTTQASQVRHDTLTALTPHGSNLCRSTAFLLRPSWDRIHCNALSLWKVLSEGAAQRGPM